MHKGNALPLPLCIRLPQTNAYVKDSKHVNFLKKKLMIKK